jgi:hypothetical protein
MKTNFTLFQCKYLQIWHSDIINVYTYINEIKGIMARLPVGAIYCPEPLWIQISSSVYTASYSLDIGTTPQGQSDRGLNLRNHLHLIFKLKINGSIPLYYYYYYYYFLWLCSPARVMASSFSRFLDHIKEAPQSVGFLLTNDQAVAETSTWQHTTHTTDKHLCPRWDSKSRSKQASGCRLTA